MNSEDRSAIEDLFQRLANVERNSGPRDREAERLIWERMRDNPASAYFMAQTVLVQEAALRAQQQKIEELEAEAGGGSGFLDSIFGDDRPKRPAERRDGPWGRPAEGGFLAGAAQTALGVTGGMLLGSAIAGMFGTPPASAGEHPDAGAQDSGDGEMDGGDDWGGFDIGGEF